MSKRSIITALTVTTALLGAGFVCGFTAKSIIPKWERESFQQIPNMPHCSGCGHETYFIRTMCDTSSNDRLIIIGHFIDVDGSGAEIFTVVSSSAIKGGCIGSSSIDNVGSINNDR